MMASRGMGKIHATKQPKPKKVLRKDAAVPTKVYKRGGKVSSWQ